jgi:2-polyprenyl-6-methoxyphenol hydroxylase-like FAD-dependent oxidoreductase
MRILISGASIAGPTLAFWLERYGHEPTLMERSPGMRKTGGHAVDLFRPALEVVERMGILPAVERRSTGPERIVVLRGNGQVAARVDRQHLFGALSDGHLEIMREDLSEELHTALNGRVETLWGDSITALQDHQDGVDVEFEHGPARRFDLVIGADGLHSNVRRLVFGAESQFSQYIGAYLAVASVPNYLGLPSEALLYGAPGRMAGIYSVPSLADARAMFLWRSPPLDVHHRDTAGQKQQLRRAFAHLGWEVPKLLDLSDQSNAFYFDSITQLKMDTWTRGRVSLVGDAGYCPGPAVGGSTSLAVVGAYVLAGELAAAGSDYARGFRAAEATLQGYVQGSRLLALQAARQLIVDSYSGLWLQAQVLRLFGALPKPLARALASFRGSQWRLHDTVQLQRYAAA